MIKKFLADVDFNMLLKDALDDPEVALERRMLAGAAMNVGLDSAYYLALELFEVFQQLASEHRDGVKTGLGIARMRELLGPESHPYQRLLYETVSQVDVQEAVKALAWIVSVTRTRGTMFKLLRDHHMPIPLLPGVAALEDGAGRSALHR